MPYKMPKTNPTSTLPGFLPYTLPIWLPDCYAYPGFYTVCFPTYVPSTSLAGAVWLYLPFPWLWLPFPSDGYTSDGYTLRLAGLLYLPEWGKLVACSWLRTAYLHIYRTLPYTLPGSPSSMFLLPTYSNPLTPYYFHVTRLASLHAILHVTWTAVFTIIPRRAVLPIVTQMAGFHCIIRLSFPLFPGLIDRAMDLVMDLLMVGREMPGGIEQSWLDGGSAQ